MRVRHVIAAVLTAVCAMITPALAQHSEQAATAQTATSAEARRADIAFFRDNFMARDASYAAPARAEAESRLAALDAQAGEVSQAYFELELARIVALADNGHTASFPGPRSRRYNRVREIRLAPFGEDFYVLRADAAHADLLGARLVAIDNRPVAQVRDVARTLGGGTPAWRDRSVPYFLESPEQMHALGVIPSAERVRCRFRLTNGRNVTRWFTPETANPDRARAGPERWFYPEPLEGEGMRSLLAQEQAPWALREPDRLFRMRDAPEMDAFVVEVRQNYGTDDQNIIDFMFDALEAARHSGRENLVLDMRMNGGGDLNITRDWSRILPYTVNGRTYILTSPWTFSAAISTVGYMKQQGRDRIVIVGENVGDRLDFYSEGRVITLPHSGAMILYATERHDYRTGCRNIANCHGSVVRNSISVESLAPDIAAPWTIEAYRAGRDPAMEAVAAAIAAQAP